MVFNPYHTFIGASHIIFNGVSWVRDTAIVFQRTKGMFNRSINISATQEEQKIESVKWKSDKKAFVSDGRFRKILSTFEEHGINVSPVKSHMGPCLTTYEVRPSAGTKISKIESLDDELSIALGVESVRIAKLVNGIGIEVSNKIQNLVLFNNLSNSFSMHRGGPRLPILLGVDTKGNNVIGDLAAMPHLLLAGATGSGKSVTLNSILNGLLLNLSPDELRLILIDPKILEFSMYEDVPHLLCPVVTEVDKTLKTFNWLIQEMERRYLEIKKLNVRNIDSYNQQASEKIPYIVVVVDELADFMLASGKLIEEPIMRLAQKARAAGIHLILATQRPSVNVVTGVIKANLPARVCFRVASYVDSMTALDQKGAEKLLGKGDMLMTQPGGNEPKRIHGAYISDKEVTVNVQELKGSVKVPHNLDLVNTISETSEEEEEISVIPLDEDEELYRSAVRFVREKKKASINILQRQFKIGYTKAQSLVERMERDLVVGPHPGGNKPREVLSDGNTS